MESNPLIPERLVLQIIDVQQGLAVRIDDRARVVARIARMIRCAAVLGIPMVANTQYRKGLGPYVADLEALLVGVPQFDKSEFNALANRETAAYFDALPRERNAVALVGIETHICVYQTAMGLLSRGLAVWVVADAVSSRHREDHLAGLSRLQANGAMIGPVEMLVYELLGRAGTPAFKEILPHILERDEESPAGS